MNMGPLKYSHWLDSIETILAMHGMCTNHTCPTVTPTLPLQSFTLVSMRLLQKNLSVRQLTDTTVNFLRQLLLGAHVVSQPPVPITVVVRAPECVKQQRNTREIRQHVAQQKDHPHRVSSGRRRSLQVSLLYWFLIFYLRPVASKPAHAMFDEEHEATRGQPITCDEGRGLRRSVNSPARPDPGIKGLKFNFKPSSGCRVQIPADGCRLHYGNSSTANPLHA